MPITPIRLRARQASSIDESLTFLLVRRRDASERRRRDKRDGRQTRSPGRRTDNALVDPAPAGGAKEGPWQRPLAAVVLLLGLFAGSAVQHIGPAAPLTAVAAGCVCAMVALPHRSRVVRLGGGLLLGVVLAITAGALVA